ncbi:rab9 effector protein with kelch motifs [Biomphalaria pfeifferi]|uniref:Rab9 effector protein with kelch motifs n=1 Tax=Biomphalaria pfeifferi TaxID=112525 RepID=A0AAD8C449_BIOPF|nr:rab9 effector protein with kelch motifs [Biomphalaria pfeifferi]
MELHPFLDGNVRPAPYWWYILPMTGETPSMRVGHSATFVPAVHANESDRVFVIGGANPSQIFNEVNVLDLKTKSWDTLEAPGFRGRYEHSAFCVDNLPGQLFVFGGATQSGSLNDVQKLDLATGAWTDVKVAGTSPSPRTHRSSVVIGAKVYFYSGGHSGQDPVGDRRVHCLDTVSMTWSTLAPQGESPKPRHGHIMVAIKNKIYLHGGMAGSTFYDDLYVLDLERCLWSCVKKKKTFPPARAAHEAILFGDEIIIFGGMNKAGALNDCYKLNTEKNTWTKLDYESPAPPNRLDFAMCLIKLKVPLHSCQTESDTPAELSKTSVQAKQILERELKPGSASSRDSLSDTSTADEPLYVLEADVTHGTQPSALVNDSDRGDSTTSYQETVEVSLVMINGGMDTEGEIFDDTLVLCLT